MTRTPRALACVAVALAGVLGLAACSTPEPTASPTAGRSTKTPTPEPTVLPEPDFEGTAADNKDYFDYLNRALIDAGGVSGGASFIDNLATKGYPREHMEVTPDTTSIGIGADNIVFSIRFGETCLIGQWGNIGYTSLVTEVLSTGRCIVGTARPA